MTNKSSSELKGYESQLVRAAAELKTLKVQQVEIQRRVNRELQSIIVLQKKIANLKASDLVITEHAILRYLERVSGIPLDTVKEAILPESVKRLAETMGNGTYPAETHRVVIRNNAVITVKEK